MNTDSGGCARKRAAMSVTLTSVKRVQSSPNLLAAGRDSHSPDSAKGFRSVRPNLQEKKSPTQSQITVNGNSGGAVSPMSYYQRPFSPPRILSRAHSTQALSCSMADHSTPQSHTRSTRRPWTAPAAAPYHCTDPRRKRRG